MKALEQLQAVIGVAVLLVIVVICAQRVAGRKRGKQRTTTASNPFEVMTELFSPARHDTVVELRSHQEQGPVTPVPDDLPDDDITGNPATQPGD